MRLRFRRRKQHGLVLLVVLSLLVLFMLILTTFLITSNQFRKAAVAQAQHEVAGDPPQVQLDRAMLQLLRDTNVRSSLIGHSILGDIYGSNNRWNQSPTPPVIEILRSQLASVAAPGNGQVLELRLTTTTGLSNRPNYYAGRVLTFISGPAKGTSTRVVAYRPAGGTPASFFVLRPKSLSDSAPTIPGPGNEVLINGAPFNGSGAGLNVTGVNGPTLDATAQFSKGAVNHDLEMALMPHFATYVSGTNPNFGGEDESYDAADYQNMFLAMIRHQQTPSTTGFTDTTPVVTAPSFHRPSLINYWINNTRTSAFWGNINAVGDPEDRRFRRAVIMRPTPWDNPEFTGSNPAFALENTNLLNAFLNGPWDVDNDRDGVADSIWIDVGFPVQTNAKGQLYKPLVAILVKDMDSRLNVNAHTSIAQATAAPAPVFDAAINSRATSLQPSSGNQMAGVAPGGNFTLPRGNGYSPAEIYLRGLFANLNEMQNTVAGRYDTSGSSPPAGTPSPGAAGADDPLSRLITTQFPQGGGGIYQQAPTPVLSGYSSPPFNYGVRSMALDWAGNPFYPQPTPASQIVDDPHELDLMTRRARDAGLLRGAADDRDRPYTPAELERLLRFRDADAPSLPDRLLRLAPATFGVSSSRARDLTTTESRYVPVPLAGYGREDFTGTGITPQAGRPVTPIDVFALRLEKAGVPAANINTELERMLPMELFRGQRFDINRLFGNGRDDNGNGVVDEPREVLEGLAGSIPMQSWNSMPAPFTGFNTAGFSNTNNDPFITAIGATRVNPRQIYARQLYCLMMLMIDQGFQFPVTETGLPATANAELIARRVAQWAVNVVDARDPDAIMTPFEYDVNPFNGWAPYVDGILANPQPPATAEPERRLVWGMETPDVLLTETLAFHDRRVRDTDWDTDMELRTTNMGAMNRDGDLDQLRKPEGSLFLEFQCVRNQYTNNHGVLPRELYLNGILNMSALAPGNFGATPPAGAWTSPGNRPYPVWQVAISEMYHDNAAQKQRFSALLRSASNPDTCTFDPLDMSMLPGTPDAVPIERTVWFTQQSPAGYANENNCFYNQNGSNVGLRPGQFLVVGPRATTHIGSVRTGVYDDTTQLVPSNQRIELNAGVAVYDANNTLLTPGATSIQPVVAMVAKMRSLTPNGWTNNAQAELNISEPLPLSANYYQEPGFPTPGAPGTNDSYRDFAMMAGVVPDVPLDNDTGMPIEQMQETGTYEDVRTVFLQRLADPTVPFHPVFNPYICVDWATIDLTVFSGDDRLTGDYDPEGGAPGAGPDEAFSTRQRGVNSRPLWSPITQFPANTPNTGASVYFQEELRETLGYVNDVNPRDATIDHFVQGEVPNEYIGAPKRTTPWITSYNRPFDSPFELLQVPAASPSRIGFEYTDASDVDNPSVNDTSSGVNPYNNFYPPYSHLTNFLQTTPVPATGPPTPAPHFYRLFDYVETPSPFVGTRQYMNPASPIDTYRAPYNYISRFRDPGRVNINMVFDKTVFDGLVAGAAGTQAQKDALWDQVQLSRKGFDFGAAPYQPNSNFPTLFANPFRASGAARLTPLPTQPGMQHREIDVTLLRPHPQVPNVPLFHVASGARHNNTTSNSHFRYQGVSRLGNMLSTTSNVFGVWMTIGYFEITQNGSLGIELGSDTGEVERHRAFYLIDRSIPVGFEPGFNHNVEKAILIRRFIE